MTLATAPLANCVRSAEDQAVPDPSPTSSADADSGEALRARVAALEADLQELFGEPREGACPPGRRRSAWLLSVSDDGIGIGPRQQERIFQIFQRLHPRQDYDGTGIGLAICRRIAERLGGAITVDSVPGEGSTFTVSIPDVRGSAA